jgi:hypothetical protein
MATKTKRQAVDALAEREAMFARQFESCSESCEGTGKEVRKQVKGKCPDPCDDAVFKDLEKEAKGNARDAAMKECLDKHHDCICAGGAYTVVTKSCSTGEHRDGESYCEYTLSYKYTGECKKSA